MNSLPGHSIILVRFDMVQDILASKKSSQIKCSYANCQLTRSYLMSTKCSNALKKLSGESPLNCLRVFNHFMEIMY